MIDQGEKMGKFEELMDGMRLKARPQQEKLVAFARDALAEEKHRFVQAGTGTGKSFAILATALEAAGENKMPSVVVCPTNNLIDQYVHKDAPRVQKVLGGVFEYLKGRSNYLCTQSPAARKNHTTKQALEIFNQNVEKGVLEWAKAGLEGWGCTGDCNPTMFGDLCAVQVAREKAAKADVIITNGHVLVWDLKVNQMTMGVANLLPAYGALFVDECHEIDAVAKNCNSDQIGPNSAVYDVVMGLQRWVDDQVGVLEGKKLSEVAVVCEGGDNELAAMVGESIREIGRLEGLIAGLVRDPVNMDEVKELRKELRTHQRFVDFCSSEDDRFISTISLEFDKDGQEVPVLNRKCVNAASWMRRILESQPSILVSGTIPPSLPKRLGVGGAELTDVGTPFDYSKSVLAISSFSAKDSDKTWDRVMEVCRAVVDMSSRSHENGGGGSLILFTSWSDLELVMPQVVKALAKAGLPQIPVFAQTRNDPQETADDLKMFAEHGHAVMGGVQSMWTGVDVPGPALRQVIIFRLPWAVPTLEVKAVEKIHGRQPYIDDMMTRLVQGAGRLVRTTEDDGRVFVADSRARSQRWNGSMDRHMKQFQPYGR